MSRRYVPKTGQRPQSERRLTVRSERREVPDYDKLTELLIRLSLQPPRDTDTPRPPGAEQPRVVE